MGKEHTFSPAPAISSIKVNPEAARKVYAKAFRERDFVYAGQIAEKIGDRDVAKICYHNASLVAAEKGNQAEAAYFAAKSGISPQPLQLRQETPGSQTVAPAQPQLLLQNQAEIDAYNTAMLAGNYALAAQLAEKLGLTEYARICRVHASRQAAAATSIASPKPVEIRQDPFVIPPHLTEETVRIRQGEARSQPEDSQAAKRAEMEHRERIMDQAWEAEHRRIWGTGHSIDW